MVIDNDGGSQWPIVYDCNLTVGWDNPYLVPQRVRERFSRKMVTNYMKRLND